MEDEAGMIDLMLKDTGLGEQQVNNLFNTFKYTPIST